MSARTGITPPSKFFPYTTLFRSARLRGGRRMTLGQAAHEEQGSRGQLVRRIGRERGEAIARHVGVLVRAELILQAPQRLELVFRRLTEHERAGLDRIAQLLRTTADEVIVLHRRVAA